MFIAPDSPVLEKVISNIEEVRARHGRCIVVASEGNTTMARHADSVIRIPKTDEIFSPILAAIPLQLFAYYVARANHCDIDHHFRNIRWCILQFLELHNPIWVLRWFFSTPSRWSSKPSASIGHHCVDQRQNLPALLRYNHRIRT